MSCAGNTNGPYRGVELCRAKSRSSPVKPAIRQLLLTRFFREEAFATPLSRIAENFDRMLADPFCWSALAADGETAQGIITVPTVLFVEWGRLGEIGEPR